MAFSGMRARHPIIRYGWRDALAAIHEGHTVLRLQDGHAEILAPGTSAAVGYLTRRSLQLLDEKYRSGGR